MSKESPSDFRGFAVNFGTSLGIALLFVAGFCILRTRDKNMYAPKTYMVAQEKRPLPIPAGLLAWIPVTLRTPDDVVLKVAGLDGYMFLKFLRTVMYLFFFFTVINCGILLPINILDYNTTVKGLDQLTMSPSNLDRKWAHVCCMIITTMTVISLVYKSVREYAELRQVCLTDDGHGSSIQARSLLVASIPKQLNSKSALKKLFDIFPGGVRHVTINRKVGKLPFLVNRRNGLHNSLETAISRWISLKVKAQAAQKPVPSRPTHRLGFLGLYGQRVDSIKHYMSAILKLNQEIASLRENQADFELQDSAFILFNNQIGAHVAAQAVVSNHVLHLNPRYLETDPSDVLWQNLDYSSFELMVRQYIGTAVAIAIAIFWFVPVGFVSSIAQLDNISEQLPFINDILPPGTSARASAQAMLPPILTNILLFIVPIFFTLISIYQGLPRMSDVQQSLMTKYYFFLLFTVVLASTVGNSIGGLLSDVDEIKERPTIVFNMLAQKLPPASTYFINYVIVKSLTNSSGELLQIAGLIFRRLKLFILGSSPRKSLDVILMDTIRWGTVWPEQTIIFTIGMVYGVISPFSNFFIGLYFMLFYVVYRYKLLYVFQTDKNQSQGMFFMKAITHIYTGVYISLFTFAGIMALNLKGENDNQGVLGPSFMFAMTIVTLILSVYSHYFLLDKYAALVNFLPVQKVSARDRSLTNYGEDASAQDVHELKKIKPSDNETALFVEPENEPAETDAELQAIFSHPAVVEPQPVVWIPQDEQDFADIEKEEIINQSAASLGVTTHGATMNTKGNITLSRFSYPENGNDLF
ncbi:phosphate metabolism protein 7 [Entomophthora muscae]|uniref:Phosphate metabolism protein 7 n=1 Tax=Entomophthora muscae TaxID=34485 RepID=A0ACC2SBY0_9FUNG|nr:phosphate metabolism protein 7 [Entomophthora muscae]